MAVNNSLVKSENNKALGFTAYLTQDAVKAQISKVMGGEKGQQFISSIVSAVQTNPQLQECTNSSIVSGALLGASLNLTPSPQLGQFYLVPFKDKNRGMVAQFVLGYHGIIQLAIRSGQYKKLNVLAIKEGELIRFDPLNEEIEVNLIADEEQRENAPTIGYYAMFEYTNGFKKAIYWSRAKMERHALRYSAGYKAKKGFTFWEKDFDSMACKTMIRQLITKWGAMDTDLKKAVESDSAVIKEDLTPTYVETEQFENIEPPAPEPAPEVPQEAPKAEERTEAPVDAQTALFS
jgi:recombination protein RecT